MYRCYICESNDFHARKDLNPQSKVLICKNCGNVQHAYDEAEEKKILDFYRKDYRKFPTTANLITTTRKLNYIKPFIVDIFKDKKGLVCGDVGCATGYLVHFLQQMGHKALGSEYTTTFRRFCEHFYGIKISEELPLKHKYDFICYYHTLEHMMAPDKKLSIHRDVLTDTGVIMISVPEWLNYIEDLSAYGNLTIDNYFHKNHINCFTRNSFQNLMNKVGLSIVKFDDITYGITVLAKRAEPKPIKKENWQEVNAKIDAIKQAIAYFNANNLKEAIKKYKNFPDAHIKLVFDPYRKDPGRQEAYFKEIEPMFSNNTKYRMARASWYYQNARYQEALKEYEFVAKHKLEDTILIFMGWCLENLGDHTGAMQMFGRAQNMNPQKWTECSEWICSIASKMPTWDEIAAAKLKEELFKKANPKFEVPEDVAKN